MTLCGQYSEQHFYFTLDQSSSKTGYNPSPPQEFPWRILIYFLYFVKLTTDSLTDPRDLLSQINIWFHFMNTKILPCIVIFLTFLASS